MARKYYEHEYAEEHLYSNDRGFFEGIKAVFGKEHVKDYSHDRDRKTVSFEIEDGYDSVSFEQMEQLSKLLGTKLINFNRAYVASEGCDTCGYGHTVRLPVSCSEVINFPVLNPCVYLHDDGEKCGAESTNRTRRLCDEHAPKRCECGKQALRTLGGYPTCNSCSARSDGS